MPMGTQPLLVSSESNRMAVFFNLFLNITPDLYQYSESQSLYFAKPTNPFVPFLSVYVESNLLTVSNFYK